MINKKVDIKQVIAVILCFINLIPIFLVLLVVIEYFEIFVEGNTWRLQYNNVWFDAIFMMFGVLAFIYSIINIFKYLRHKKIKLVYPILLFMFPFAVYLLFPFLLYTADTVNIILIILCLIFLSSTIFLGNEFLKKFKFMQQFIQSSNQLIEWKYAGNDNKHKGMRNIVLRGHKPFSVLVGFNLGIPFLKYSGFDYYGYVKSDENNMAVFSTYMGKNPCTFKLFISTSLDENHVSISFTEDDQKLSPQASFKPHWFQRLSFYG